MDKLGKMFNSTTMNGRANVAKATYATIAVLYIVHRLRRSKSKKPEINEVGKAGGDTATPAPPDGPVVVRPKCAKPGGNSVAAVPPTTIAAAPEISNNDDSDTFNLWEERTPVSESAVTATTVQAPLTAAKTETDVSTDSNNNALEGAFAEANPEDVRYSKSRKRRMSLPLR